MNESASAETSCHLCNQLSMALLLAGDSFLAGPESCNRVSHEVLLRVCLHRAIRVLAVVDLRGKGLASVYPRPPRPSVLQNSTATDTQVQRRLIAAATYFDGATLLVHVGAEAGRDAVLAHHQDLGPEVSRGNLEHPASLRGEAAAEVRGPLEGAGSLVGGEAAPGRGTLDDAVAWEGVAGVYREAAVGPKRRSLGIGTAERAEQVLSETARGHGRERTKPEKIIYIWARRLLELS